MPTNLLLILIFSAIGILDTLYLIYHRVTKTPVKCLFFPNEWCVKVNSSKYSKTFGVPNPVLGLVMYLAITYFTISFLQGSGLFWPIQGLVGFGFLFSLYFTAIQAFVLRAFCTWCVVSAINFVVLAVATFLM